MKAHQDSCEKSGRFVEAELAKQRIIQFKKTEEEKLLNETKRRHQESREQLDIEQREELEKFNEKFDIKFYEMNSKFTDLEKKLKEDHEIESQIGIEEFNKQYPEIPKPSLELLNLNKILDSLVKQKEYL